MTDSESELRRLVRAAMDRAKDGGWDCHLESAEQESVSVMDSDAEVAAWGDESDDELKFQLVVTYVDEWRRDDATGGVE